MRKHRLGSRQLEILARREPICLFGLGAEETRIRDRLLELGLIEHRIRWCPDLRAHVVDPDLCFRTPAGNAALKASKSQS